MPLINSFGDFGTNDFIEYWTAFRLFINQLNPYDPALMEQLQRPLGWSGPTPLMMWNPPWLLLIMAPILMLDFPHAATAWLCINLGLIGAINYFCIDLVGFRSISRLQKYLCIPLTICFFPLYISLAVGQLGVLLAFAFIGAIWAIINKRTLLGALCLALWTLKVHLFVPVAVFLFFKSLRNPALWIFFAGGIAALSVMVLGTEYLNPGVTHAWMAAFSPSHQTSNLVVVQQWQSATLTGGIRLLFADGDLIPLWPAIYVPAIAIIGVALCSIRLGSRLGYLEGALLSALCSMIFGPFGWVFDFTILLPGYLVGTLIALASKPSRTGRKRTFILVYPLLVQLIGWLCLPFLKEHHVYMWFPPAVALGVFFYHLGGLDIGDLRTYPEKSV